MNFIVLSKVFIVLVISFLLILSCFEHMGNYLFFPKFISFLYNFIYLIVIYIFSNNFVKFSFPILTDFSLPMLTIEFDYIKILLVIFFFRIYVLLRCIKYKKISNKKISNYLKFFNTYFLIIGYFLLIILY